MTKNKKIALLFGGASNEHEVSLRSSYAVFCHLPSDCTSILIGITKDGDWLHYQGDPALIENGEWQNQKDKLSRVNITLAPHGALHTEDGSDITPNLFLPILHGQTCEDGKLQGLLDLIGIPYVGCGCAASAFGMDKAVTKMIAEAQGIPVASWLLFTRDSLSLDLDSAIQKIESRFPTYPIFVKAVNSGSSVGAFRADDRGSLAFALTEAAKVDFKILVEEFVTAREVETAVLEKDGVLTVFAPGEIEPCADFYDYDTKYKNDTAHYYIPARVSEETLNTVREYAARIFRAIGARHLSRVDFFVTKDERIIFNENNTLPGFTSISMYPKLAEAGGVSFDCLVKTLIKEALS